VRPVTAHDADRLRRSYRFCRRLHARHGRSYYLATLLLPRWKQRYVHALYGLARHADDLVDLLPAAQARVRLAGLADALTAGRTDGAVLPAVQDTLRRWQIPASLVTDFLASMWRDLEQHEYPSYAELEHYMHGSAVCIAWQMLPILQPLPGCEAAAAEHAKALGTAFQLTNFIRDVGEDLVRGRLYLPLEDLDRFGVTRRELSEGRLDAAARGLLEFQIARAERLYLDAAPGVGLLAPSSRPCIAVAHQVYREILAEIRRSGYQVLDRRATVALRRRVAVAAAALWQEAGHELAAGRDRATSRRPSQVHQHNVCNTSAKPKARSSTGS
jgi:phytoene synthase